MAEKTGYTNRKGSPKSLSTLPPYLQQARISKTVGKSSAMRKDKAAFMFTCNNCGGHNLMVTRVWTLLAGVESERWQEWGPLKDNHHWRFEFEEKIEEKADHEVQRGDIGEYEEDDSASEPEEYEVFETEHSSESDEFFLNCGDCDREVEFGWSKPDRRGLIMPVEFSDFNPVESWPDPKYEDVWRQRGWLPKMDVHIE